MANRTNAPVHHVAGGDHVHARRRLHQGLLHQDLDGGLVHDVTRVVQQTILAVAGEGVERHIGHDAQLRKVLFQFTHHSGYQALGVLGFAADGVFERRADDREQGHHRDAQFHAVLGHGQQQIHRQTLYAGHGGHSLSLVVALKHEHRVNQIVCSDLMLSHQVAREFVAAQAPWAAHGERCVQECFHGQNCA